MRLIPFLAVLLLGNSLFADAKAVISGPEKVRPGQLFVLETTGSVGEAQRWIMPSSDIQSLECGTKIGMAIEKAGTYTFHLVVADKAPTIDVATHTVIVGNANEPPPPPPPPPPPTTDFAALAATSKQLAKSLNDPATMRSLSDSLLALSQQQFTDVVSARKAVSVTIEAVLLKRQGVSRDKTWLSTWRVPVANELERLAGAGQFPTPDRYLLAVKAIAESLQ